MGMEITCNGCGEQIDFEENIYCLECVSGSDDIVSELREEIKELEEDNLKYDNILLEIINKIDNFLTSKSNTVSEQVKSLIVEIKEISENYY